MTEAPRPGPISAPDLQAHADRSLEAMRKRLLDLKTSNVLLNLRPRGRGYIRLVDEVPEALFLALGTSASFAFRPVPQPPGRAASAAEQGAAGAGASTASGGEEAGASAPPDAAAVARAAGIDPSYDLPEPSAAPPKKHADDALQTLLFAHELEASLEQVRRRSTTLLQELGVPTLYMAFGSLEWFDAETSDRALNAPLVLLPVELKRVLRGGKYSYKIRAAEEAEAQTNGTLRVKLRRDFGLELPELDDSGELGPYLRAVAAVVQEQSRWRVRRWVTLGVFRFERSVMYADLGAADWAPTEHPVLGRLLGVTPAEAAVNEETPNLDTPEFDARAPALVADADSSQTMAVVDALAGKNLVVRGPPGTGKSQTITNLIAAALAEGKSVLFVAEKMAALEVVRKRLEDARLGEFALELHSTKASKRAVLDQIQRRFDAVAVGGATEAYEARLAEARRARNALNDYLGALHAPFGELGLSLFDLLWQHERLRPAPETPWLDALSRVRPEGVLSLRPEQLLAEKDALLAYATRRAEVRAVSPTDEAHPWFPLVERGDLGLIAEQPLLAATRAWTEVLGKLAERAGALLAEGAAPTLGAMRAVATEAAAIAPPREEDWRVVDAIAPPEARAAARRVHDAACRLDELERGCAAVGSDRARLRAAVDSVAATLHAADELDLEAATFGQLEAALAERLRAASALGNAAAGLHRAAVALGWGATRLRADLARALLRLGEIVRTTDRRVLLARSEAWVAEKPPGLLNELAARLTSLRARAAQLDASMPGWRRAPPPWLRETAAVLRASGWWARASSADYRRAWLAAVALVRDARLPREEAAARLEHSAAVHDEVQAVLQDPRVQRALGAGADWATVDFELWRAVDAWAAEIRRTVAGLDEASRAVREAALRAPLEALDAVAAETAGSIQKALAGRAGRGESDDLDAVIAADRALAERGLALARTLRQAGVRADASLHDLRGLPSLLQAAEANERALQNDAPLIDALGPHWDRVRRAPALLLQAVAWVDDVEARAQAAGLRGRDAETPWSRWFEALRRGAAGLVDALDRELAAREGAASSGASIKRLREVAGGAPGPMAEAARRAIAAPEALRGWMLYRRTGDEAARLPRVRALLEALPNTGHDLRGLEAHYEWLVCRELAHEAAQKYPLLEGEGWSGERLASERARFAELDREVLRAQQAVIRARLLAKALPAGVGTGPRSTWTDLALLKNEAKKQRAHIAIRDLVGRAAHALRAAAPCFMMSPLSVAQFLPREAGKFDLLVVDEASQMRPEDAIGALLRAKQAVVVGDENQLPPTSFFDSAGDEGDGDEAEPQERVESILDWGLGSFAGARELLWHYRSRHESLIAFSNDRFYGGRLLVFPAAREASATAGVGLRAVEGLYAASKNELEARAVVAEAVRFMREQPGRSLGVVAMNRPQAELIETLLDAEIGRGGDDAYRERWAETLAPFFVKNLESVQGDERDVMFVSLTYGPASPGGAVPQRFGPVNGADGHRRLNVLFTRAREQLVVFSSLRPADVRVEPASSRGVAVLKDYLEYAAQGGRLLTPGGGRRRAGHDSAFEAQVADVLRGEGFEIVPQVGVQGFFLDLGVKHPAHPRGYVCGVECDGAAYHSTRSARDRDRIRQGVLEGLGWHIVRVWSADWFRNPARARAKLLDEVRDALERGGAHSMRVGRAPPTE